MRTLIACLSLLAFATFAGDQRVTLLWDKNPESDNAAYLVYFGNSPRQYHSKTNVGNLTQGTVSDLAAGTNWFFAVTALSRSGLESDYSNEVTNTIPPKPQRVTITTNWWNVPPMRTIVVTEPAR